MSAEKKKTILLVEDEAITAMSAKMTLEKYGYKVIIANSGEEAVAVVEKTPGIDLILMDINLGAGMDGTEAAAIIIRQRDLPVVFLSSHTEPEVVAKTEKITSYGYVVKNSSITVLDASIKMAFKLFEAKIKEKEKEKALQESEASYRMLFSGASDGILLADSRTRQFRYANPAICRMLGYTEEELLRINVADIHPKESLNHVLAEFAALARGEIRSSPDIPCLRKDGTVFYVDISQSAMILAGQEYHAGFFHDITERRQAEEAVFQSKKDWEDCFDSITDMITIHDNDYNIVRANKAGKALLKLPELEKHLQAKCFSFYHGADAPPAGCPSCECLKSGLPGVFELFEPHLNRYLEIRAIPRFDSHNQRAGLIHIVRDITERMRASDTLKESELRLKAQYQGMPVPTFTWQKKGEDFELIDFNDAAKDITHEKIIEFVGRKASDLYADRQDILHDLQQCLVERKVIKRETQSEHFIPGKYIILTIVPIPPDLVMVHMKNINERKRAEVTLRESEERLKDITFSMADWVWEVDANGVYTYSSDKGLDFLGSSRGDIIGKTPFDFMPADEAKRVAPIFSEIVANKRPIKDLENWNIGRNGEQICLLTNGVPILDEKGNLKGYRGVDKDITARKQVEKLAETLYKISQAIYSTDNLNELFEHVHRALSSIIPMNNLFIALLKDDGKALTFPYNIDEKDTGDAPIIATDNLQSLTVEVLKTKKPLLLDETELLDRYATGRNKVWGAAPKCWLGVPLMIRETVIGVMAVQDYNKCGAYSQKDVALLEAAAGQIAIAIDRKRAEDALRESEEWFRTLYENSTIGLYRTTPEGRIHLANPALVRMLGYSSFADLSARNLQKNDFDPSHPRTQFIENVEKDGEVKGLESAWKRKDGIIIWVRESARAFRDSQVKTLYYDGTVEDITERKQAEAEIERQLAEKETLLKEVHHRIKNNIASIEGLLFLRVQSSTNPEAVAVLQEAIGRVNSMRILYDKLLLSEGYKDIPVKNYAESLTDAIVALFPGSAKVTVEKRITDFHLDPKRLFPLGLIINELITNKMKHAFIDKDTGVIQVSLTNVDKHVTLTIQDNGIGLPDGFDIEQAKGFGLMLVKMLTQQLGGFFSMAKQAGTRCTVEFNI